LTPTYHDDRSRRQALRRAIVGRVHLVKRLREPFLEHRDLRGLHYPGCNDNVRSRNGFDRTHSIFIGDTETAAVGIDRCHSHLLDHRQVEFGGIPFEVFDKLVTVVEAVGFVTVVRVAG
jgi:hypothetical protein